MNEIQSAINEVLERGDFINGQAVDKFTTELSAYMDCFVIPCANGTDALQIALMSLDLEKGSEVIIPSFNYISSAEVCRLLGFKIVYCDVSENYNIDITKIESLITSKTRVIIPVHLFGMGCDMSLMEIANKHNLIVIEDNAQSLGAEFKGRKLGAIGHIGTTSFFPTKNLGGCGDGGAIFTKDYDRYKRMKSIANHGQLEKYNHVYIGINSRLDSIQAAILSVKLKYLDLEILRRRTIAEVYKNILGHEIIEGHTYNQYTLLFENRDYVRAKLAKSFVYYPKPIYKQIGYYEDVNNPMSDYYSEHCLSLPMTDEAHKIATIIKNI